MRVAILFENFGPYHVARLAAASKRLEILALQVSASSAVYQWEAPPMPTGCRVVTLSEFKAGKLGWSAVLDTFERHIGSWKPDVMVVPGWGSREALAATYWAANRGLPIVVMSASNRWDIPRSYFVERLKRRIAGLFAAGLCASTGGQDYLQQLGLPQEGIFLGYDAVDNDYFWRNADRIRSSGIAPQVDAGSRLEERHIGRYFLTVSRFVPKKNILRLIEAYSDYRMRTGPVSAWPLVILGDGELREPIEILCRRLNLVGSVHMPGFVQYEGLPEYYGTAGAFILASTSEQWGLVVNEAMASGLPVLVSNRCGCAQTLVADGINGLTFDPFDRMAIAKALSIIAEHPALKQLGAASLERIADWGPERFAAGLSGAAHFALTNRQQQPSLFDKSILHAAALML